LAGSQSRHANYCYYDLLAPSLACIVAGDGGKNFCAQLLSERLMRSWLDWLNENRKRQELTVFLVLTLVLAPALAVATVGSYGLGVWVYQMVAGPPSSPAKAVRTPGVMRE
jgi:nitrate reductase NapE